MDDALLRLSVLGTFRLEKGDTPVNVPGRKARALLAYLALHPEPHAREQLAALFWSSGADADARLSLRVTLSQLKKIHPALVLADTDTVQLNPAAPLWVDANEFRISKLQFPTAQTTFALYRGDLLSEFYDDWILQERDRLRQEYVDALLRLVEHYRSQSEYKLAIHTAIQVLQVDPANERAHQHLMFCYVASGDRNAALAQYLECERALRDELGVEPARDTTALYQWIKQAPAETGSPAARLTNLPLLPTSFIGRQREMTELKRLLGATRLLSLIGAGGSGKTRLAVQTATEFIDHYADGVWWVELALLTEGSLVTSAVARTFGVAENADEPLITTLVEALRERQLLLVLDNCEHVLGSVAQLLTGILAHCPRVQVLATSREPLGLTDEILFRTPLLALPRLEAVHAAQALLEVESVQLFVERARSANEFEYTESSAQSIARIVRRLDGIPLAIELAAARARTMPVDEIERALDDRFRLLRGSTSSRTAHHETLQMLIDWSYDLLATPEKLLLQRLAAFQGGATLDAVVAVAYGKVNTSPVETEHAIASLFGEPAPIVAGLLRVLADRSLILFNRSYDPPRYEMLETIREYGLEKLAQAEETAPIHDRLLAYFVNRTREIAGQLVGPDQKHALAQLDADAGNLRIALDWARQQTDTDAALAMVAHLWRFWWMRGYMREGRAWADMALTMPGADTVARLPLSTRAMNSAGVLAMYQGDYVRANQLFEGVLAGAEQLGNRAQAAAVYSNLGIVARHQGDLAGDVAWQEKSLVVLRELGDKMPIARTLNNLATVLRLQGDHARANSCLEESLALRREAGDLAGVALTLINLGEALLMEDALDAAAEKLCESIDLANQLADTLHVTEAATSLGIVRARQGHDMLAVHLLAAIQAARDRLGIAYAQLSNRERYAEYIAQLRAHMGDAAFDSNWSVGQTLSLAQAVELALQPLSSNS